MRKLRISTKIYQIKIKQRDKEIGKNELDGYYKNYKPQKLNLITEGRVTEAEGRISELEKKLVEK